MKTTHSLEQVEALMWKESDILKDPNVGKDAKKEARRKLRLLEKHFEDCRGKEMNGKKYPVKQKPEPISKKELLALIDEVPDYPTDKVLGLDTLDYNSELDLTGAFISDDRTEDFPRTSILDAKFLKE